MRIPALLLTCLCAAHGALAQTSIALGPPTLSDGVAQIEVRAVNDTWFTLEASPDLANWQPVAIAQVQLADVDPLEIPVAEGTPRQFYRAKTPPPLRITPASADLPAGGTVALGAVLSGVANNAGVTWSVLEPGSGTVTPGGVYTAPTAAGAFHVRATAKTDARNTVDLTVNVVTATAAEQARYADAATYSDNQKGDALLVMKDGAVVYEHYNGTTTATTAHLLASGTKSFNVALFALGKTMGLWTLDDNVSQTITEWQNDANKSQITIRQLLSLSSGLQDSPLYSATNVPNLDTYDLAINGSTTPYPPGVACIYAPSNFQVLAAMFERKTGGTDPVQFLYDRLFTRLGYNPDNAALWTRDKLGKPQMAGGAYLTGREWLNYGKLWFQNGLWEGQTLLKPTIMHNAVTYDNPTFKGYGLSWWLNLPTGDTYDPGVDQIPVDGRGDGTQIASNVPTDMYMAAGTGKQRLYVIPSLHLVIARFGHGAGGAFSDHTLLGKIIGVP